VAVEFSNEGSDIAFQRWREDIGEYDGECFDSYEKELCASYSSCEELDEDDFQEQEYRTDELRNLEDIWWHEECMPNVYIYKKNNHMRDRERKTKKYKTKFTRTDGITRREALISHFQNHESLQVALWPTSRARPPQPTQGLVPAGQAPSGP
jgi:hypothetical protein